MILLPRLDEMQGADWSPDGGDGGSFLTGLAAPLPLGTFRLPDDPHLIAAAPPDDDPVLRADTLRERAGQVFQRHRAVGAFNRDLDALCSNIAESPDWSEGLSRFDKESANLRAKHLAELHTPEHRAAFERHADEFAAMQRIGLKRALTERQQADAISQLDDQLAYYARKAATAPNEVFRQIAIDAGQRLIAELRDAGYLFPEGADKRQQAFLGLIDGADLEQILHSNPDEALGILDNPALFPNVDAQTREKLRRRFDELDDPVTGTHKLPSLPTDPPAQRRTLEFRDGSDGRYGDRPVPFNAPAAEEAAAATGESAGPTNVDDIAEALAPLLGKNDGLRELVGALQEKPDDLGATIRLAAGLVDLGPGALEGRISPKDILLGLQWLLEKGKGLITRGRQPPGKEEPQLLAPKQRGEEPAPPTGGPAPISPPRAKPPTVPPPETKPPQTPPSQPWPDDILAGREKAAGIPSTEQRIHTPEGQQRIAQNADKLYSEGARMKEREAWIVMGRPGSGKSSLAKPIAQEKGALIIDTDAAKPLLPEYQGGIGGGAVHKEATAIRDSVLARAVDAGDNVVLPIVGSQAKDVSTLVRDLKDTGYKVHIIHVDVPQAEGIKRAYERYREGGQFVDPAYMEWVADRPKQNFETLIREGVVDSYAEYDNNIPKGQQPRQVRSGQPGKGD